MSAGTAYSKRYAGGFVDLPSQTTAIDSTYLNAVEIALLQLIGVAPTVDGQVAQWDNANTRFGPALILNKNVDPAAAIASSKIDFTGANGIVDANVASAAAIARSKLNFGSGLVNADIATAAAIAYSKLSLAGAIQKTDLAFSTTPIIARKTTAKVVNTSAAATDLLNGEFTVAANTIGATGILRLSAWGDWKNNSGGTAAAPRFQLQLGAGPTTIIDSGAGLTTVINSATREGWGLEVIIANFAATNAQRIRYFGWHAIAGDAAGAQSALTTGEGWRVQETAIGTDQGYNTAAIDTTANMAIILNTINGSANALYETTLQGAMLELL